jgi:hypothetical protein
MFKIIDSQHPSTCKSSAEILSTAFLLGVSADYLGGGNRFIKVGGDTRAVEQLIEAVQTLQYDLNQQPDDDNSI